MGGPFGAFYLVVYPSFVLASAQGDKYLLILMSVVVGDYSN